MFDSDADRLESIKALGGQLVRTDVGAFWAIFDRDSSAIDLGIQIEGRTPVLTCRSSDVEQCVKAKEQPVLVSTTEYRVKRAEPDTPAPGWTILLLKI